MNDIFLHIKIAIQSHALPMQWECIWMMNIAIDECSSNSMLKHNVNDDRLNQNKPIEHFAFRKLKRKNPNQSVVFCYFQFDSIQCVQWVSMCFGSIKCSKCSKFST